MKNPNKKSINRLKSNILCSLEQFDADLRSERIRKGLRSARIKATIYCRVSTKKQTKQYHEQKRIKKQK